MADKGFIGHELDHTGLYTL